MFLYSLAQFWQNSFRNDRRIIAVFFVALALNILTWVLLMINLAPFGYLNDFGTIPLHYNLYFGIDLIGVWYLALTIPVIGVLVLICNTIVAYLLYPTDRELSYVVSAMEVVVGAILFAAAIFIILLNS